MDAWGLEAWHLWLLAASVIAIGELLLLGSYYLLAVAGGAAITGACAALLDVSSTVQWFIFALATLLVAALMRMLRSSEKKAPADDISYMVGKQVEVLERVAPRGRVSYKSVAWYAESDAIFEVGEVACIERVDGSTLYIKKVEPKTDGG